MRKDSESPRGLNGRGSRATRSRPAARPAGSFLLFGFKASGGGGRLYVAGGRTDGRAERGPENVVLLVTVSQQPTPPPAPLLPPPPPPRAVSCLV